MPKNAPTIIGPVAEILMRVIKKNFFWCNCNYFSNSLRVHVGPNDLSLFQPKCAHTQDLSAKLFVYYHAKAVKEQTCLNLSPHKAGSKLLNGRFIGQHYITWDIKVPCVCSST